MSYSFNVRAATKDETKKLVGDQMAEVVRLQPIHKVDGDSATLVAAAFIDALRDPKDGEVITCNVSGSVGWEGSQEDASITTAGVSVSASIARAE